MAESKISFMNYSPSENDWKFWLVVNPAKWIMPTLIVVAITAILVHIVAFSVAGQGWNAADKIAKKVAVAEQVAPASVAQADVK